MYTNFALSTLAHSTNLTVLCELHLTLLVPYLDFS